MKTSELARRRFGLVTIMLGALLALGCGPSWTIVAQQNPNPMVAQREFFVAPVGYVGLMVGDKSEAQYLAGKDGEQQQSFLNDKAETAKNMTELLIATAGEGGVIVHPIAGGGGPFVLVPNITFVEPGNFNGFVNIPTTVEMRLRIIDAQQQPIDEVIFRATVPASMMNPSSGGRMHTAGKNLGEQAAQYLLSRTGR
ncbi:MAG TPA: hypothetical protein PK156_11750 [Polyangium sp.]|nr:hypothetical protein [Polyangium sp.]